MVATKLKIATCTECIIHIPDYELCNVLMEIAAKDMRRTSRSQPILSKAKEIAAMETELDAFLNNK